MTTSGTKEWAESNINFSKGCSNNCKYCYAHRMATRFGWKENWEEMENKEELIKKGYRKRNGTIMCPSSHDITDSNIDLAIKVFQNILEPGNTLLIVSKPKQLLIKKICLALETWKDRILFRFTIGTLNDLIRAYWEPGAPEIQDRINALKYAYKNEWKTSVSIEPFLDENVNSLVVTILPYITDTIWIGPMNKIHVPKEYWSEKEKILYSKNSLLKIKSKIDSLHSEKIRFKDHFLSKINV